MVHWKRSLYRRLCDIGQYSISYDGLCLYITNKAKGPGIPGPFFTFYVVWLLMQEVSLPVFFSEDVAFSPTFYPLLCWFFWLPSFYSLYYFWAFTILNSLQISTHYAAIFSSSFMVFLANCVATFSCVSLSLFSSCWITIYNIHFFSKLSRNSVIPISLFSIISLRTE